MKMRRATRVEHPPFGEQVTFAQAATGLGAMDLGALAVGATAVGAVAIGTLVIRVLAVKRGGFEHLEIVENHLSFVQLGCAVILLRGIGDARSGRA
jgi:hypothetical protein